MSGHQPIDPEVARAMNAIAGVIDDALPPGWGFTLLVFKFGEGDGHRMNYISSAGRGDMLAAMKELIANFEGRVANAPKTKQ